MIDKEILSFAREYLTEAANDFIESDNYMAIIYNKYLKDISSSTGKGEFITDKEILFFAYKQLEKMAIDTVTESSDSMQIFNKWQDMAKELKQAKISRRIPCSVGDTVYLTHEYSDDIWAKELENDGNICDDLTDIKKGVITAFLTSFKTKDVYAEINIGQDKYITISASDYFDKYSVHPTAERAEAYVRWLSKDRIKVVYAVNNLVYDDFLDGRKAFNIFKFVDYNEILGITPNGAKVFFKYLPEAKDVVMIVP